MGGWGILRWTSVLDVKFGFVRRGSRNPRAQAPAVVIEESWPSFAESMLEGVGEWENRGSVLMFGVMNIHCGRVLASRSL